MNIRRIHLSGHTVRLEPLTVEHAPALARVGLDLELWRLQPAPIATTEDMLTYVNQALDEEQRGIALPFAIIDQASGAVIGSTR